MENATIATEQKAEQIGTSTEPALLNRKGI